MAGAVVVVKWQLWAALLGRPLILFEVCRFVGMG
jgi:hypothetical protein